MNSKAILQLSPDFLAGVVKLHDLLEPITWLFCGTGLLMLCAQAYRENSIRGLWPNFIRVTVAVALLSFLPTWADTFQDGVTEVVHECFGTTFPGGAFAAYEQAIATKFGTASIGNAGQMIAALSGGQAQALKGQLHLTHYGYEKPGDPNYDARSANGIGAFPFDTAPGSLNAIGAGRAVALSPDVAAAYNLQPNQKFNIQTADGGTMSFVYADKTDPSLTNVIDVFDPENMMGNLSGVAVTSVAGGQVVAQQSGGFDFSHPVESFFSILQRWSVWALSIVALAIMMGMVVLQQFLYQIELAISPIFIGLMLVPPLRGISTHFFTNLAGLLLWPFGWVISGLGTQFFVDLAVGASNYQGEPVQTPGLYAVGGLVFWVLLAIWTIGSAIAAPLIISKFLTASSSGMIVLMGATIGKSTSAVAAPVTGGTSAAVTGAVSGVIRSSISPNYARRPNS
jgi:hypothetical protein